MKKIFTILFYLLAFFAALSLSPKLTMADVAIQTFFSRKPTPEFQKFVKEFVLTLRQHFNEIDVALMRKMIGIEKKTFFLVERRDKKIWQVGLCKLKDDVNPSKPTYDTVFWPLWHIEGKRLKNKEKLCVLAREAATFLFYYLQREGI